MHRLGLAMLLLLLCSGCTHMQLKRSTLNQIRTVSDLQQRQVLDNLAMFVANPNSLPFFSVPGSGTTAVNDAIEGGSALDFTRETLASWGLTFGSSREVAENWTLGPINDPQKLRRMQCIYQLAVGATNRCVDCCDVLAEQFPPHEVDGSEIKACNDPCRIPSPGWYCFGCKSEVPKGSQYVGRSGKLYVWVTPDGVDELTNLTMAILEVAVLDPPGPDAQVVRSFDNQRRLTGYTVTTQEDLASTKGADPKKVADTVDLQPSGRPASGSTPSINPYYNPLPGLIRLPAIR